MKPSQIHEILDLAMKAREQGNIWNPMFVGPPGLGKTEIVQQWFKKNDLGSLTLTPALLEAPDMRGYPDKEMIDGKMRMVTLLPSMWPTSGKGGIILEELNRGTTSVMNCTMALSDVRRGFDNYKLPDNYIVVGCINPDGGKYDTNTMDPALADRFEVFQVGYDKETHLQFMKDTKYHKDIILFVESGMFTYVLPEDVKNAPGAKYVSPRTLSKVNAMLMAGIPKDSELFIYQAILGDNIGKDFYNFKYNESPVFFYDLVKNFDMARDKLVKFSNPENFKAGMISITMKDIVENNEINDKLLTEVIKIIPVEQGRVLMSDLEFKREDKTIFNRIFKGNKDIQKKYKAVVKGKEE